MWKKMKAVSSIVALSSVFSMSPQAIAASNPDSATTTPINHVVVIFQENVSFDHYFGTYPYAKNPVGEPKFVAKPNTPSINGLTDSLLTDNPNLYNPRRLSRSEAVTDDMDHEYKDEQKSFNSGLMDKFVQYTSGGKDKSMVMNYYDGNTVTAIWNYAQHFAMSDNSYNTNFGPSTVGALDLIAGQTHGATAYKDGQKTDTVADEVYKGTVIADPQPYLDIASSSKRTQVEMSGKNVGDLLNVKNITWGWFEGGFRDPKATHKNIAGGEKVDYIPHHEPFQYYPSTRNPNHLPPISDEMIGKTDQANHQYDMNDFWKAADSGNLPAVSYLKAPGYQDGHAGYSDPIDEQRFLVDSINHLQKLPEWKNTAVIIAYDDSDGWYDHVMSPIVSQSNDGENDALTGPGSAGVAKPDAYQSRAGYGPRLPLMVISPYAKSNFVDHSITDQTSILRFIEDNWSLGRIGDQSFDAKAGTLQNMFDFAQGPSNSKLLLDPISGQPKFNDVSDNDQNTPYIYDLYSKNIIAGTGDNNFSPNETLTREQFAKMMVVGFGINLGSNQMPFTDVSEDWAKPYVSAAYAAGIIKGTGDTSFSPNDQITREQAAVIVWRYLSQHGVNTAGDADSYDASDAQDFAKNAVKNAMALGLRAEGKSAAKYASQNNMNRGDAAALTDLAIKQLQK